MLENVARPCSTAATMTAKSSSNRTRSEASRATSVPVVPMAMPMSACCRAGPSFTPSPVMATTWPRDCSARAIRSLSSGSIRARTNPSRSTSAASAASSSGRSLPSSTGPPGSMSPTCSAMARAVAGWSPVIMATWIPAPRQAASAFPTPARGGSCRPTSPTSVRSASSSSAPPAASGSRVAAGDGQDPQPAGRQRDQAVLCPRGPTGAPGQHGVRRPLDQELAAHGNGHPTSPGVERMPGPVRPLDPVVRRRPRPSAGRGPRGQPPWCRPGGPSDRPPAPPPGGAAGRDQRQVLHGSRTGRPGPPLRPGRSRSPGCGPIRTGSTPPPPTSGWWSACRSCRCR